MKIFLALAELPEAAWDSLLDGEATPFLRWAWLEALEHSGCASESTGWRPRHLTLWDGERLVAAAPAYLKEDSDGDFSRDWGWADAALRADISYYPKLVLGVPFTPCSGRRLLVARDADRAACVGALVEGARAVAKDERAGSWQVLFPIASEAVELEALGLVKRVDFQYHWRNEGYRAPEDFLARFDSKRRNQARRERAAPQKQGIAIRTVRGDGLAADAREWAGAIHALHRATIDKMYWGRRWINRAFYERVLSRMPDALEIVEAKKDGQLIAGAFNVASATHLYGRYWGCLEEHPFLHFNVCLHHSIDECIRRGVQVFEGGAGGEHKLHRGFEPAETFSLHEFFDARLARPLAAHLKREAMDRAAALARWRAQSPILKHPAKT